MSKDVIIGVDAGTSVLKAVAFTTNGKELAITSTPNIYKTSNDGSATQSPNQTWENCVKVISEDKGSTTAYLYQRTEVGGAHQTWRVLD